ncbi:hypothetical protein [Bifidobacterium catenulatum]|uniref:Uncharacterized protein n=1 Tax=Bifidobacterium catenulatum PV20-2 TaxID=1447716 RepID=A0A0A7I644_9BIFI|nr:hypothetical protein [Bifidobacterium catenulatum]AIZ15471.1 hypothetical protein AH68_06850 [Bifidobacterium catenulatum PV20-2]
MKTNKQGRPVLIPASRIIEQSDVQASGGMDAVMRWNRTGISVPLEGAYATLCYKVPEKNEGGEE